MKKWIILIAVLVIVGLRMALPSFALKKLNEKGKVMNPIYVLHADDMTISLLKASVTLHHPSLTLKETDQKYMKANALVLKLDVLNSLKGTLSFREWVIKHWVVTITPEVQQRYAAQKKWKKPKIIPIKKISTKNAKLILVKNGETITIDPISGTFENYNTEGLTKFTFDAPSKIAHMKVDGVYDPKVRPIPWKLDLMLEDFKLTALNDMFKHKSPIVFKSGRADVYFQGDSRNRVIKATLKPFLENVSVDGNKKQLKVESPVTAGIAGKLIEWFLSDKKNKSLGLEIPFTIDHGEFTLDKKFDLKKALKQMAGNPPSRGFAK